MRKITYTTSGLLIIINYYYQHLVEKRKMKQKRREIWVYVRTITYLEHQGCLNYFIKKGTYGWGHKRPVQAHVAF